MNTLIKFIALVFLTSVKAVTLNCNFINKTNLYCCDATSNILTTYDQEVNAIAGQHLDGKSNNDVRLFSIRNESESQIVPLKVCKFLQKLKKFYVEGNKINKITRSVYESCESIEVVSISYTLVSWLDEDTFDDLPNLEILFLSHNRLVMLPSNLLSSNKNLNVLECDRNQLAAIDMTLSASIITADFTGNICVNENYLNFTKTIETFNAELQQNCASPEKRRYILLSKINEENVSEIKTCETELQIITSNYSSANEKLEAMEDENSKLNNEVNNLKAEESELSLNLTEAYESINELKSQCNGTATEHVGSDTTIYMIVLAIALVATVLAWIITIIYMRSLMTDSYFCQDNSMLINEHD